MRNTNHWWNFAVHTDARMSLASTPMTACMGRAAGVTPGGAGVGVTAAKKKADAAQGEGEGETQGETQTPSDGSETAKA